MILCWCTNEIYKFREGSDEEIIKEHSQKVPHLKLNPVPLDYIFRIAPNLLSHNFFFKLVFEQNLADMKALFVVAVQLGQFCCPVERSLNLTKKRAYGFLQVHDFSAHHTLPE